MRRKTSGLIAALVLFAVAGMLVAQNADPNTGGPTKNTLKLRLVEPAEGATISGSSVRVTVGYNNQVFGTDQGSRCGESNFPQPRFDVYVDNKLNTTLKGTESNTATIDTQEEAFLHTLRSGTSIFDVAVSDARAAGTTQLSGEKAFQLHDTHGFPIDLTPLPRRLRLAIPRYEPAGPRPRRPRGEHSSAHGVRGTAWLSWAHSSRGHRLAARPKSPVVESGHTNEISAPVPARTAGPGAI
jgi:hypothetical protein